MLFIVAIYIKLFETEPNKKTVINLAFHINSDCKFSNYKRCVDFIFFAIADPRPFQFVKLRN